MRLGGTCRDHSDLFAAKDVNNYQYAAEDIESESHKSFFVWSGFVVNNGNRIVVFENADGIGKIDATLSNCPASLLWIPLDAQ